MAEALLERPRPGDYNPCGDFDPWVDRSLVCVPRASIEEIVERSIERKPLGLDAVEFLIRLLDAADGDPDAEVDNSDYEYSGDEFDCSRPERLDQNGEYRPRVATWQMTGSIEDDEEDDFHEYGGELNGLPTYHLDQRKGSINDYRRECAAYREQCWRGA